MKLHTLKVLSLSFAVSLALFGCSSSLQIDEETKSGPLRPGAVTAMQAVRGATYVREHRVEDVAKQKRVVLTSRAMSLRDVLEETLPGYAIIPQGSVDLNEQIDVSANGMTLADFIEYIEGTKDLNIEFQGGRVIVSDFETREWNLNTFASSRNVSATVASTQTVVSAEGTGNGGSQTAEATGSSVGYSLSEDEWLKIIDGAKKIIGADSSSAAPVAAPQAAAPTAVTTPTAPGAPAISEGLQFDEGMLGNVGSVNLGTSAYVEGIRTVGIVTAGGSPSKMKILDRFLQRAIRESTKIINVQVESYDVILNDSKQKGVDWDALITGTLNGNPLNIGFTKTGATSDDPFWNIGGSYESDHVNVKNFLIKFLQQYGRVELQDQPNITVRNGVPAQIYAGQELTYIADVQQSQDLNGNTTVTPDLARMKIGVTLSVTVRVLDDERLLVDIWPVISNLGNPDTIAIGDYEFQTPRVNLKEFSTQLITSSGRPVHLGGLISKRMGEALETLPWKNVVTKAINPFFENVNNQIERRELVLVVTPTLIEGRM